ncbi:GNAT family N-acetyltransferase [Pelagibius marinus]|uniref:GNAT family N-acetyltransferase n=1 Tax=Pelagibius marinus TaxID=2762760 RepID=UPI00187334DD|nr:GNAT family N-acetyltransferase [Pelagibius marinus]
MTEKSKKCKKQQDAAAKLTLRRATPADIPAIDAMHFLSVHGLGSADYSPAELEAFITHGTYDQSMVYGGTYYLIEDRGQVVASGGWAQHLPVSEAAGAGIDEQTSILSATSAKIRSVFVHPKYARRGLGSRLVHHAEEEAQAAGFRLLELWASLTGVPLYRRLGYQQIRRLSIPGGNGTEVPAVHMAKLIALDTNDATAA